MPPITFRRRAASAVVAFRNGDTFFDSPLTQSHSLSMLVPEFFISTSTTGTSRR